MGIALNILVVRKTVTTDCSTTPWDAHSLEMDFVMKGSMLNHVIMTEETVCNALRIATTQNSKVAGKLEMAFVLQHSIFRVATLTGVIAKKMNLLWSSA